MALNYVCVEADAGSLGSVLLPSPSPNKVGTTPHAQRPTLRPHLIQMVQPRSPWSHPGHSAPGDFLTKAELSDSQTSVLSNAPQLLPLGPDSPENSRILIK